MMMRIAAGVLTSVLVLGLTVFGVFGCSPQGDSDSPKVTPDESDAMVPVEPATAEPAAADVTPAEPPAEESAASMEEEMPSSEPAAAAPAEGSATAAPAEGSSDAPAAAAPDAAPAADEEATEAPGAV